MRTPRLPGARSSLCLAALVGGALSGASCSRADAQTVSPAAPGAAVIASAAATPSSGAPGPAAAQPGAAPAWYDAAPMLASLRAPVRADPASLARAAGVATLDALPLYDLRVDLSMRDAQYRLDEEVWFTNTEGAALDELVFRVYANAVGGTSGSSGAAATPGRTVTLPPVRLVRGSCNGVACTVTAERPDVIAVRLAAPLPAGGRVRVSLAFEGVLSRIDSARTNMFAQGMEGLAGMNASEGAGDYGLLAIGDQIASMANFHAVLARRNAGAWERRDDTTLGDLGSDTMSHVRASVRVEPGVRVFTSGVASGSAPTPGGGSEYQFTAAMVRDFALMASPALRTATRRVGDVQVHSHFLLSEQAAGQHVLDAAAGALAVFERRFGAYPYPELDVVEAAIVGGAGGVEFSGLVTVASMFYRPAMPTDGALSMVAALLGSGGSTGAGLDRMMTGMREFVTAHEVAHQFWHGLVGSDSRRHPFVDESLAQYSAMVYLEDRYGAVRARDDGDANVKMNYQFMRLLGHADGAVDRPVGAFGGAVPYAGLVYGKGPYMFAALRREVGDPAFFEAIQRYVQSYRFGTAPPRGFIETLAQGAPQRAGRVRLLARRWLDEPHGDEDLGRADVSALMRNVMGSNAPAMGEDVNEALRMLGGLGLFGGPGGGGGGGGVGTAGGGVSAADMNEVMSALRGAGLDDAALQQMIQGGLQGDVNGRAADILRSGRPAGARGPVQVDQALEQFVRQLGH